MLNVEIGKKSVTNESSVALSPLSDFLGTLSSSFFGLIAHFSNKYVHSKTQKCEILQMKKGSWIVKL